MSENYEKHFSNEKFWDKVKKVGKKAGKSIVYVALLLYYVLQKPEVPKKTKLTIIAALGYFILPLDLIPDFVVGIGYTDDLGALGIALFQVALYVDKNVKMQSREKLEQWFGKDVDVSNIDEKYLS